MFAYCLSKNSGRQHRVFLWLVLAVALPLLLFDFCTVTNAARHDFPRALVVAAESGASTLSGLLDGLTGDNGDFELAIALPVVLALVVVQTRWFAPYPVFASHVIRIDTPPPRPLA